MTCSNPNRWRLLLTVGTGLLLIALDNSVLYAALPTLTRELGASATQGLWIINAYPLVMAGLLLGSGTLGDNIGHRRMFLAGLALFGLASLAAAFAPSAPLLIAARAFLAVGAAAMMPATLALIRVGFTDERERNLAIAIWGSLAIAGNALGPIVGGALLERFWWGSVFLLNVPIVIAAFASAWVLAPHTEVDHSRPWDLWSSMLALVTLSALVVAIKEMAHAHPSWPLLAAALGVAVLAGLPFVRRQARLAFPLLDFSIFRNPAFTAGTLAAAFAMFAIAGLQLATTQRFQLVAGFTPLQAGLLVAVVAAGALPTGVLGGFYLHRVGLRWLISGGLAVSAVAVFLATWGLSHGTGWLIAGMTLAGAGLGAAMSVASTAIVGNVAAHRAGMASSVEEVSYEFGSLLAVALLGSLLSALYTHGLAADVSGPARDSLTAALALAHAMGDAEQSAALSRAAVAAFDQGYVAVMYAIAAVLAVGAAYTGMLLRHHGPGSVSSSHSSH